MQKEEKLEWENHEKPKTQEKKSKPRPNVKSKNRRNKEAVDTTKRIKDYFPTVPRVSKETKEDSGVGAKDETRVTDHTTPDKPNLHKNGISQANTNQKGKQVSLNGGARNAHHQMDICVCPHC
jgi:hypothetical protein